MVLKLLKKIVFRSYKTAIIVFGISFFLLTLSITSFAQQGGCEYRNGSAGFLCYAIPGASSYQNPIVPDNTAVTQGNTTYYGKDYQYIPSPGITYIPGDGKMPTFISPSPSVKPVTSLSPSPSPTTCNGGTCCTPEQLMMGAVCTIKDASAGCGCPINWSCSYLGRNNSDGSQTIQCLPPAKGGVPIGQACSPAGARCAPYNGYEAECGFNSSGNYVCLATRTPIAGTSPGTATTNTTTSGRNTDGTGGTNTGIAGGTTCDPVADGKIDENDFNLWKQEYLHTVNTTESACMSPNNTVDLLGFQAWKNIHVLHLKTNFN